MTLEKSPLIQRSLINEKDQDVNSCEAGKQTRNARLDLQRMVMFRRALKDVEAIEHHRQGVRNCQDQAVKEDHHDERRTCAL